MIVSLRHFLDWLVSAFRCRADLVLENLALRRQLLALHALRPVPTKKSILIEAVEFMRLRCVLCQSHVYPFCLLTLLRASLLPNSGSFAS